MTDDSNASPTTSSNTNRKLLLKPQPVRISVRTAKDSAGGTLPDPGHQKQPFKHSSGGPVGGVTPLRHSTDVFSNNPNRNKRSSLLQLIKPSMVEDATLAQRAYYYGMKYFFLVFLLVVVCMGIFAPEFGRNGGVFHPQISASWVAVIVIFFLTGLGVKTQKLKQATTTYHSWELNVLIHCWIFVYFPLLGFAITSIFRDAVIGDHTFNNSLLDGLMIMSCLPTTIGTAVVYVINSRGNEAAGIVNTTAANLIGIGCTPFLIFVYLGNIDNIAIEDIVVKLSLRVIVPFFLGQLCRVFVIRAPGQQWLKHHPSFSKKITEVCLLFIVFSAISQTFYAGFEASVADILIMIIILLFMHISSAALVWYSVKWNAKTVMDEIAQMQEKDLRDNRAFLSSDNTGNHSFSMELLDSSDKHQHPTNQKSNTKNYNTLSEESDTPTIQDKCFANFLRFDIYDRITILYCSIQKTVAFGLPMIEALYGNHDKLGMYITPLLLYLPIQYIFDSFFINPCARMAKTFAIEYYQQLKKCGIEGKKLSTARKTMIKKSTGFAEHELVQKASNASAGGAAHGQPQPESDGNRNAQSRSNAGGPTKDVDIDQLIRHISNGAEFQTTYKYGSKMDSPGILVATPDATTFNPNMHYDYNIIRPKDHSSNFV